MSMPRIAALSAVLWLTGCASLDSHTPAQQAQTLADSALGAGEAAEQISVPETLASGDALQLSLARSPVLAEQLASTGMEAADIRQATRLSNPLLRAARRTGDGAAITSLSLEWELLDALLAPARSRLAAQDYQRLSHDSAHLLIQHGQAVRSAWLEAAASQQRLASTDALYSAFEAAAQLAARQHAAGNLSARAQARIQADYADYVTERARQRLQAVQTREHLNALMGLWGDEAQHWRAAALPPLPLQRPTLADAERFALEHRQDVAAARANLDLAADRLHLTERTRWLNLVGIGVETEREQHGATTTGPSLSLSLPLLDTGGNLVERDRQAYQQAWFKLQALALEVRADVRSRYAEWQLNYDIARHQTDAVVPLRQQITAETLKHYNGMLDGVYTLLDDARRQLQAEQAADDALVAFWTSQTALESALGSVLPATPSPQEHAHGQP